MNLYYLNSASNSRSFWIKFKTISLFPEGHGHESKRRASVPSAPSEEVIARLSQKKKQREGKAPTVVVSVNEWPEAGRDWEAWCPSQRERVLGSDLSGASFRAAMKLLVVLFALTVVTGGQAVTASSELSLGTLIGKFSTFEFNSLFAVYGKVAKILQALDTPVVIEQLNKIPGKLERALPPEISEVKEILSDLSKTYKVHTYRVFDDWSSRYFQEGEAVMKALELYVDPVASKALWCVEWLEENIKPVVIQMYQPFDSSLNQALESLGSTLSSYTEQEEIGEILQTSLDEAAKLFRMGMENLNKQLKPYLIPFLKEYKKYDPALREWLEAPLFPPPKED
ncbi:uncharacterized protein LOC100555113 [Anolis carolinensis]|uniref:uncharacterized protein LOC100555113 n=1 Tax=Anolis carolinensis TaxID=28377 RepID=UPI0007DB800C|nr:PREDICTED: uncharacterized protein LOC100555113 [Anolis carolinensis]|eukprot:XP_003230052.3 PREDICTED: uncharacterized protein LOC100555113 [Anolis carolinensis]